MIQGLRISARIAALVQFCAIGFAFQASSEVQIVPRARPAAAASDPVLRVDSSLVLIPVHVTAASAASVTDLKKEDFPLFEPGVLRSITHFPQDDPPFSAAVLF